MINKIKTLGYASVLASAMLGSYSLGRMQGNKDYKAVPVVQSNPLESEVVETPKSLDSHTLAVLRLKNALGNRLEDEAGLYEMDDHQLRIFADIYENVEYAEELHNLNKYVDYQTINPLEYSLSTLTKLEKNCPWDLIPSNAQYTQTDKAGIYTWISFNEFHGSPICPVW